MKRGGPLKRYTPLRAKRSKPRPGRLRGKAMEGLRQMCFELANGFCNECRKSLIYDAWTGAHNSYHMAHIKAKRIGGDSLENVRALCGDCHRAEHGNPLPRRAA